MLHWIQSVLTDLYDVRVEASVEDFMCDEDLVRSVVGDAVARGELLVVAEEPDGASVGIYVDPDALAALRQAEDDWEHGCFESYCLAAEGVSHFVYLMFRATNEEQVSQLELEVQAEVDKYASTLLAGNGAGLIARRDFAARSRRLRRRLFHEVSYRDGPDTEEGERYRVANRVASRYLEQVEARYLRRGDVEGLAQELRRFYRLGIREKFEVAGAT
jgi:hypothetical protein